MKKIALFVDWDNLRNDIKQAQKYAGKKDKKNIDYNKAEHIEYFLKSFVESDEEEIYRIFFYTAKPYEAKQSNQKQIPIHPRKKEIEEFIDKISTSPYFAVRLGKLKYRQQDNSFEQKQVDMLMGLDIAHLSYCKLVDRILVFSKDTDVIPALKCARICGIQVKIANLRNGMRLDNGLKKHSDDVVERLYKNIKP